MTDSTKNKNSVQLSKKFDKEVLKQELELIISGGWQEQSPYFIPNVPGILPGTYHNGEWNVISLRSLGGDAKRTDPGGPSTILYEYTKCLDRAPYFRSILEDFGPFVRAARLSRLGPKQTISEHHDSFIGLKYGQVRLHIPIVTNPKVLVTIEEDKYNWSEGELWYGDFTKTHSVSNLGKASRVHLIIDVCVTEKLLRLFPEKFVNQLTEHDVLLHRPSIQLPLESLANFQCQMFFSAALLKGVFEIDDGIKGSLDADIILLDDELTMRLEGKPVVVLEPVSETEFKMRSWSSERIISFQLRDNKVESITFNFYQGQKYKVRIVIPTKET